MQNFTSQTPTSIPPKAPPPKKMYLHIFKNNVGIIQKTLEVVFEDRSAMMQLSITYTVDRQPAKL